MRSINIYRKLSGIVLFVCLGWSGGFAQDSSKSVFGPGTGLEFNFQYARIVKHTRKLSHFTYRNSPMFELVFLKQTSGEKLWSQYHKYPAYGLSLAYTDLGNTALIGSAISLFPFLDLDIVKSDNFRFQFRGGSGIAWFNNIYDRKENAENVAIGSHLNNITFISLLAHWKVSENIYFRAGATFKHFSNASFKSPNLGLNIPGGMIGGRYFLQPPGPPKKATALPPLPSKWNIRWKLALGLKETTVPGGPRYPVYITSLAVSRHIGHANLLSVGINYEYNTSIYDFIVNNELFEENRHVRAMRYAVEIGDEIWINKLAVIGQFGFYLHKLFLTPAFFYNRVGMKYYYWDHQLFTGIYLKSHYGTADHLEMAVGFRF